MALLPALKRHTKKRYYRLLKNALELLDEKIVDDDINALKETLKAEDLEPALDEDEKYDAREKELLVEKGFKPEEIDKVQKFTRRKAAEETDRATYQAMEAFIHNLNTMHSRAGAQTPFSSINYGMDTSTEGRMVMKNILLVTEAGLGHGETPIFPIQIFRVKEGINYNPGEPNYDLFKLACRVSAKRLFPNFSFRMHPTTFSITREHPKQKFHTWVAVQELWQMYMILQKKFQTAEAT